MKAPFTLEIVLCFRLATIFYRIFDGRRESLKLECEGYEDFGMGTDR
jgi:hypothetical protein